MNKDYFLGGSEDEMEFMPIIPLTEDGSESNDDQPIPLELPLLFGIPRLSICQPYKHPLQP